MKTRGGSSQYSSSEPGSPSPKSSCASVSPKTMPMVANVIGDVASSFHPRALVRAKARLIVRQISSPPTPRVSIPDRDARRALDADDASRIPDVAHAHHAFVVEQRRDRRRPRKRRVLPHLSRTPPRSPLERPRVPIPSAAPPRVSLASVSANVALAICAHSSPCFPCPSNTPISNRPVSRTLHAVVPPHRRRSPARTPTRSRPTARTRPGSRDRPCADNIPPGSTTPRARRTAARARTPARPRPRAARDPSRTPSVVVAPGARAASSVASRFPSARAAPSRRRRAFRAYAASSPRRSRASPRGAPGRTRPSRARVGHRARRALERAVRAGRERHGAPPRRRDVGDVATLSRFRGAAASGDRPYCA